MATRENAVAEATRMDWEEVDLYRFFAAAFGEPTRERFEWLHQAALGDAVEELWKRLGNEAPLPELGGYDSYEDYESTYLALFEVGMPEPPIPLVESSHRKSEPAQAVALDCTLFYEVMELRANPAGYPLDHLVTQLEFLSAVRYAGEKGSDVEARKGLVKLERDFLERHLLRWFPSVEQKLQREQPPLFYPLTSVLNSFLRRRHAETTDH